MNNMLMLLLDTGPTLSFSQVFFFNKLKAFQSPPLGVTSMRSDGEVGAPRHSPPQPFSLF